MEVVEKKKVLVPELRFKEFTGNWKEVCLGRISQKIKDKNRDHKFQNVLTNSATKGIVNQEDYFDREITTSENLISYSVVDINDFIYNPRTSVSAPVGPVNRNKLEKGIMSPLYTIFRFDDKNSLNFIEIYFKTNKWHGYLRSVSNVGARHDRMNLLDSSFFELPLYLPTLPEQQKIAAFLSAVDEKIQQLRQKKALLEKYKKGLMQKLFPKKVGEAPELRFTQPNGSNYPDWEFVGGNELFENISDKNHNSDLPILAITQDQGAIPRDMIDYNMTVTDKSVASYKVVQVGDFVISLRTFQGGIEYSNYKGICSPAYIVLRANDNQVDKTFYRFFLKTERYIKELQKNLEGIRDGKMISYKYFSEIKLPFPSKEEQQKIADFLSGIDQKINQVETQINQTQTFKKGLLQQMFV